MTSAECTTAALLLGITERDLRSIVRGKTYDPGTNRWYKDGFTPWQLVRTRTDARENGWTVRVGSTFAERVAVCRVPLYGHNDLAR